MNDLRSQLEAAGLAPQSSIDVSLLNESAFEVLHAIGRKYPNRTVKMHTVNSKPIRIDLYDDEGYLLPYAIVLDIRGMWKVVATVKV